MTEESQVVETASEMSIDDAANALMDKWETAQKPSEQPEPETNPQAVAEEDVEDEVVDEVEEVELQESDEQEAQDEEEALSFSSINELAEALEMTPEQFLEDFKGKVKVDGQEDEVSLSEALNGYQRQADYQRKTAELAENRRQFEQAVQQQHLAIQQEHDVAQASLQAAEEVLLQEFQGIDWSTLEQADPGQAALYRQKYQERYAQIQNYQQQYNQQKQVREAQMAQAVQQVRAQEAQALLKARPDWTKDTDKEVSTFLASNGVPHEVINGMNHHSVWLLAKELMDLRAEKANTKKAVEAAKAKVKPLPKMLKPGAKKASKTNEKAKALRARLKKSGSLEDEAAMLLERMG